MFETPFCKVKWGGGGACTVVKVCLLSRWFDTVSGPSSQTSGPLNRLIGVGLRFGV